MRARLLAAAFAASAWLAACTAGGPPRAGESLFRGDQVTVDRDFIYLDDPLFLQSQGAYGHRGEGTFSFRLPIFFNARPGDTLRLAAGAVTVKTARDPALPDSAPPVPVFSCFADTLDSAPDSADLAARLADTTRSWVWTLRGRPGDAAAAPTRIGLGVHCLGYRPPFGRIDTLSLAFSRSIGTGAEGPRAASMILPFHVSYRGPVVSILLGTALLYVFTQAGWWISESR